MPETDEKSASPVLDEEILYRSIWLQTRCFYIDGDGKIRISSEAFADSSKQTSLFRHHLCDAPPLSNPPRMGDDQSVARLLAAAIRRSGPIQHRPDQKPSISYMIDVLPDTSNGQHRAHVANPTFETRGAFEKLKISLSILIEADDVVIPPPADFVEALRSSL